MTEETPVRHRILEAAFSTFIEAGYAATTMLEIARRAHVSKRELYAVVGNKQEMLATCIRERSQRLRPPADLPEPHDRASLEGALIAVGSGLLRETTQDTVVAAFRLAIAEAVHAPEVAARRVKGVLAVLRKSRFSCPSSGSVPLNRSRQRSWSGFPGMVSPLLAQTDTTTCFDPIVSVPQVPPEAL